MKKQTGLTLIEIMIALVLGLIVIAGAMHIYIGTVKNSGDTLKSTRLNYDLGMAMSLMTNDIKRAGFWGGAVIETKSINNPATNIIGGVDNRLQIGTSVAGNDCIIYTYDSDGSGFNTPADQTDDITVSDTTIPVPNEYYGFRFNSVVNDNGVTVGRIQMRMANATCTDTTAGSWQSITDENMVNITEVTFSFAPFTLNGYSLTGQSRCLNSADNTITNATNTLVCAAGITAGAENRVINIQLVGEIVNDDVVTKILNNTVKVRNNRVFN